MTMPPAPANIDDEELLTAKKALAVSEDILFQAQRRYDNMAAQRDAALGGGATTSTEHTGDPLVAQNIQDDFLAAAQALAKAEEQYGLAHRALTTSFATIASRKPHDAQVAEWRAQAQYHAAQSALAYAQADSLKAKTPAEKAEAEAKMLSAQNEAKRIGAEITQLIPAQANNLNASAAEATERIRTLFPAQAAQATAAAQVSTAQAGQITAETEGLLPVQIRNLLAQSGYSEAMIKQVEQTLARPQQIASPVAGPNLAFQDPQSGQVSGQRDPRYQDPNTLILQNEQDALDTIQGMMEKRQMTPQEATTYINAIREQSAAAMRGASPYQESLERNRRRESEAGIGRDILQNRLANAGSLASSLTQGLHGAASDLTRPFDFAGIDPFAMAGNFATEMGGGQGVYDTASSLVQGLQGTGQDGLPELPPGSLLVDVPDGGGGPQAAAQPPPAQPYRNMRYT